jgi:DNA-binding LacI/PurR family transcriptional regulator
VYYGSKSVNVNDSLKSEQMTIQEIARRARVLVATVSRIISRVLFLRPAVIRSVHRVIREVGYYPNTNAGAVGSGVSYRCAQPD